MPVSRSIHGFEFLGTYDASIAATPEELEYTGAKDRIDDFQISLSSGELCFTLLFAVLFR